MKILIHFFFFVFIIKKLNSQCSVKECYSIEKSKCLDIIANNYTGITNDGNCVNDDESSNIKYCIEIQNKVCINMQKTKCIRLNNDPNTNYIGSYYDKNQILTCIEISDVQKTSFSLKTVQLLNSKYCYKNDEMIYDYMLPQNNLIIGVYLYNNVYYCALKTDLNLPLPQNSEILYLQSQYCFYEYDQIVEISDVSKQIVGITKLKSCVKIDSSIGQSDEIDTCFSGFCISQKNCIQLNGKNIISKLQNNTCGSDSQNKNEIKYCSKFHCLQNTTVTVNITDPTTNKTSPQTQLNFACQLESNSLGQDSQGNCQSQPNIICIQDDSCLYTDPVTKQQSCIQLSPEIDSPYFAKEAQTTRCLPYQSQIDSGQNIDRCPDGYCIYEKSDFLKYCINVGDYVFGQLIIGRELLTQNCLTRLQTSTLAGSISCLTGDYCLSSDGVCVQLSNQNQNIIGRNLDQSCIPSNTFFATNCAQGYCLLNFQSLIRMESIVKRQKVTLSALTIKVGVFHKIALLNAIDALIANAQKMEFAFLQIINFAKMLQVIKFIRCSVCPLQYCLQSYNGKCLPQYLLVTADYTENECLFNYRQDKKCFKQNINQLNQFQVNICKDQNSICQVITTNGQQNTCLICPQNFVNPGNLQCYKKINNVQNGYFNFDLSYIQEDCFPNSDCSQEGSQKCPQGCRKCLDQHTCTLCQENYFLFIDNQTQKQMCVNCDIQVYDQKIDPSSQLYKYMTKQSIQCAECNLEANQWANSQYLLKTCTQIVVDFAGVKKLSTNVGSNLHYLIQKTNLQGSMFKITRILKPPQCQSVCLNCDIDLQGTARCIKCQNLYYVNSTYQCVQCPKGCLECGMSIIQQNKILNFEDLTYEQYKNNHFNFDVSVFTCRYCQDGYMINEDLSSCQSCGKYCLQCSYQIDENYVNSKIFGLAFYPKNQLNKYCMKCQQGYTLDFYNRFDCYVQKKPKYCLDSDLLTNDSKHSKTYFQFRANPSTGILVNDCLNCQNNSCLYKSQCYQYYEHPLVLTGSYYCQYTKWYCTYYDDDGCETYIKLGTNLIPNQSQKNIPLIIKPANGQIDETRRCSQIIPNCINCLEFTDQNYGLFYQCTECKYGFIPSISQCIPCPDGCLSCFEAGYLQNDRVNFTNIFFNERQILSQITFEQRLTYQNTFKISIMCSNCQDGRKLNKNSTSCDLPKCGNFCSRCIFNNDEPLCIQCNNSLLLSQITSIQMYIASMYFNSDYLKDINQMVTFDQKQQNCKLCPMLCETCEDRTTQFDQSALNFYQTKCYTCKQKVQSKYLELQRYEIRYDKQRQKCQLCLSNDKGCYFKKITKIYVYCGDQSQKLGKGTIEDPYNVSKLQGQVFDQIILNEPDFLKALVFYNELQLREIELVIEYVDQSRICYENIQFTVYTNIKEQIYSLEYLSLTIRANQTSNYQNFAIHQIQAAIIIGFNKITIQNIDFIQQQKEDSFGFEIQSQFIDSIIITNSSFSQISNHINLFNFKVLNLGRQIIIDNLKFNNITLFNSKLLDIQFLLSSNSIIYNIQDLIIFNSSFTSSLFLELQQPGVINIQKIKLLNSNLTQSSILIKALLKGENQISALNIKQFVCSNSNIYNSSILINALNFYQTQLREFLIYNNSIIAQNLNTNSMLISIDFLNITNFSFIQNKLIDTTIFRLSSKNNLQNTNATYNFMTLKFLQNFILTQNSIIFQFEFNSKINVLLKDLSFENNTFQNSDQQILKSYQYFYFNQINQLLIQNLLIQDEIVPQLIQIQDCQSIYIDQFTAGNMQKVTYASNILDFQSINITFIITNAQFYQLISSQNLIQIFQIKNKLEANNKITYQIQFINITFYGLQLQSYYDKKLNEETQSFININSHVDGSILLQNFNASNFSKYFNKNNNDRQNSAKMITSTLQISNQVGYLDINDSIFTSQQYNEQHYMLLIASAYVNIKNTTFQQQSNSLNLQSSVKGGLAQVYSQVFDVLNCTFIGGTAFQGGAIYWIAKDQAKLLIDKSQFINNNSKDSLYTQECYGGAIFIDISLLKLTSQIFILNSDFKNNLSLSKGGSIYISKSLSKNFLVIRNCNFIDNISLLGSTFYSYQNHQRSQILFEFVQFYTSINMINLSKSMLAYFEQNLQQNVEFSHFRIQNYYNLDIVQCNFTSTLHYLESNKYDDNILLLAFQQLFYFQGIIQLNLIKNYYNNLITFINLININCQEIQIKLDEYAQNKAISKSNSLFLDGQYSLFQISSNKVTINNIKYEGNQCLGCEQGNILINSINIIILNSLFHKNIAFNGGSLYLKTPIQNSISRILLKNQFFQSDVQQITQKIQTLQNCSFIQNHAIKDGGAIFLENSNIFVQDSYFYQNLANDYGGVITSQCDKKNIVDNINILSSKFIQNVAKIGSIFFQLQNLPIQSNYRNILINNTATLYGNTLISQAVGYQGFLDGNKYNKNITIYNFTSGLLKENIQIQLINSENQVVSEVLNDIILSFEPDQEEFQVIPNSINQKSGIFNLKDVLSAYGRLGTNVKVKVTSNFNYIPIYDFQGKLTNTQQSESFYLIFQFRKVCPKGTTLVQDHNKKDFCYKCPTETFNLVENSKCFKCPFVCENDQMFLPTGYWRSSLTDYTYQNCLISSNCIGDIDRIVPLHLQQSPNRYCEQGNIGILCLDCDLEGLIWQESYYQIIPFKCQKCGIQFNLMSIFIAILNIAFYYFLILEIAKIATFLKLRQVFSLLGQKIFYNPQILYLVKYLIEYMQVLAIITPLMNNLPLQVQQTSYISLEGQNYIKDYPILNLSNNQIGIQSKCLDIIPTSYIGISNEGNCVNDGESSNIKYCIALQKKVCVNMQKTKCIMLNNDPNNNYIGSYYDSNQILTCIEISDVYKTSFSKQTVQLLNSKYCYKNDEMIYDYILTQDNQIIGVYLYKNVYYCALKTDLNLPLPQNSEIYYLQSQYCFYEYNQIVDIRDASKQIVGITKLKSCVRIDSSIGQSDEIDTCLPGFCISQKNCKQLNGKNIISKLQNNKCGGDSQNSPYFAKEAQTTRCLPYQSQKDSGQNIDRCPDGYCIYEKSNLLKYCVNVGDFIFGQLFIGRELFTQNCLTPLQTSTLGIEYCNSDQFCIFYQENFQLCHPLMLTSLYFKGRNDVNAKQSDGKCIELNMPNSTSCLIGDYCLSSDGVCVQLSNQIQNTIGRSLDQSCIPSNTQFAISCAEDYCLLNFQCIQLSLDYPGREYNSQNCLQEQETKSQGAQKCHQQFCLLLGPTQDQNFCVSLNYRISQQIGIYKDSGFCVSEDDQNIPHQDKLIQTCFQGVYCISTNQNGEYCQKIEGDIICSDNQGRCVSQNSSTQCYRCSYSKCLKNGVCIPLNNNFCQDASGNCLSLMYSGCSVCPLGYCLQSQNGKCLPQNLFVTADYTEKECLFNYRQDKKCFKQNINQLNQFQVNICKDKNNICQVITTNDQQNTCLICPQNFVNPGNSQCYKKTNNVQNGYFNFDLSYIQEDCFPSSDCSEEGSQKCPQGCRKCLDQNTCTMCQEDYFLFIDNNTQKQICVNCDTQKYEQEIDSQSQLYKYIAKLSIQCAECNLEANQWANSQYLLKTCTQIVVNFAGVKKLSRNFRSNLHYLIQKTNLQGPMFKITRILKPSLCQPECLSCDIDLYGTARCIKCQSLYYVNPAYQCVQCPQGCLECGMSIIQENNILNFEDLTYEQYKNNHFNFDVSIFTCRYCQDGYMISEDLSNCQQCGQSCLQCSYQLLILNKELDENYVNSKIFGLALYPKNKLNKYCMKCQQGYTLDFYNRFDCYKQSSSNCLDSDLLANGSKHSKTYFQFRANQLTDSVNIDCLNCQSYTCLYQSSCFSFDYYPSDLTNSYSCQGIYIKCVWQDQNSNCLRWQYFGYSLIINYSYNNIPLLIKPTNGQMDMTRRCSQIITNCINCLEFTDQKYGIFYQCTECKYGFIPSISQCIPCPEGCQSCFEAGYLYNDRVNFTNIFVYEKQILSQFTFEQRLTYQKTFKISMLCSDCLDGRKLNKNSTSCDLPKCGNFCSKCIFNKDEPLCIQCNNNLLLKKITSIQMYIASMYFNSDYLRDIYQMVTYDSQQQNCKLCPMLCETCEDRTTQFDQSALDFYQAKCYTCKQKVQSKYLELQRYEIRYDKQRQKCQLCLINDKGCYFKKTSKIYVYCGDQSQLLGKGTIEDPFNVSKLQGQNFNQIILNEPDFLRALVFYNELQLREIEITIEYVDQSRVCHEKIQSTIYTNLKTQIYSLEYMSLTIRANQTTNDQNFVIHQIKSANIVGFNKITIENIDFIQQQKEDSFGFEIQDKFIDSITITNSSFSQISNQINLFYFKVINLNRQITIHNLKFNSINLNNAKLLDISFLQSSNSLAYNIQDLIVFNSSFVSSLFLELQQPGVINIQNIQLLNSNLTQSSNFIKALINGQNQTSILNIRQFICNNSNIYNTSILINALNFNQTQLSEFMIYNNSIIAQSQNTKATLFSIDFLNITNFNFIQNNLIDTIIFSLSSTKNLQNQNATQNFTTFKFLENFIFTQNSVIFELELSSKINVLLNDLTFKNNIYKIAEQQILKSIKHFYFYQINQLLLQSVLIQDETIPQFIQVQDCQSINIDQFTAGSMQKQEANNKITYKISFINITFYGLYLQSYYDKKLNYEIQSFINLNSHVDGSILLQNFHALNISKYVNNNNNKDGQSDANMITSSLQISNQVGYLDINDSIFTSQQYNEQHYMLLIASAYVNIKNTTFQQQSNNLNQQSSVKGGLAQVYSQVFNVLNCTFIGGTAFQGGAIYWIAKDQAKMLIDKSQFINNNSKDSLYTQECYGGAIFIDISLLKLTSQIFILNSDFKNNLSLSKGGSIYISKSLSKNFLVIRNCNFIDNISLLGSTFYSYQNHQRSQILFQFVYFYTSNNMRNLSKNVLANIESNLQQNIELSHFGIQNYYNLDFVQCCEQGNISINSKNAIILDSLFSKNVALNGGSLYLNQPTQNNISRILQQNPFLESEVQVTQTIQTLQNCSFIQNFAIKNGGAIFVENSNLYIYESYFSQNQANNCGGVISSQGNKKNTIDNINFFNSKFIQNVAKIGSVFFQLQNLPIQSNYRNVLINNTATLYGNTLISQAVGYQGFLDGNQKNKNITIYNFTSGLLKENIQIQLINSEQQVISELLNDIILSFESDQEEFQVIPNSIKQKSGIFNLKDVISVYGRLGTNVKVKVTSNFNYIPIYDSLGKLMNTQQSEPFYLIVQFRKVCPKGTTLVQDHNKKDFCYKCSTGTFNLAEGSKCFKCPFVCENDQMFLPAGYWRSSLNGYTYQNCLIPSNCIGDIDRIVPLNLQSSPNRYCEQGNIGILCLDCDLEGLVWQETFYQITPFRCQKCGIQFNIMSILIAIVNVAFYCFLIIEIAKIMSYISLEGQNYIKDYPILNWSTNQIGVIICLALMMSQIFFIIAINYFLSSYWNNEYYNIFKFLNQLNKYFWWESVSIGYRMLLYLIESLFFQAISTKSSILCCISLSYSISIFYYMPYQNKEKNFIEVITNFGFSICFGIMNFIDTTVANDNNIAIIYCIQVLILAYYLINNFKNEISQFIINNSKKLKRQKESRQKYWQKLKVLIASKSSYKISILKSYEKHQYLALKQKYKKIKFLQSTNSNDNIKN
ncbi:hypothetical protein ABPG74_019633 [Tetrahymena malaccensis]